LKHANTEKKVETEFSKSGAGILIFTIMSRLALGPFNLISNRYQVPVFSIVKQMHCEAGQKPHPVLGLRIHTSSTHLAWAQERFYLYITSVNDI
jgi:hypothetical protein